MSHATVLVLTPQKPDDVDDLLSVAMEPYNEDKEVAPYTEKCFCVGRIASNEAHAAEKPVFELQRAAYHAKYPDVRPFEQSKEQRRDWKKICDESDARQREAEKAHPLFDKVDPTCEDCKGSGTVISTSNPKSKWDWYSVGGRWDKMLPGERNEAPLSEIIEWIKTAVDEEGKPDARTFALMTSGEWHERGQLGWFGCVSNESDDWDTKYIALCVDYLAKNPNAYAIVVDYHI